LDGTRPGSDDFYDQLLRPTIDNCARKGLDVIVDWHCIGETSRSSPRPAHSKRDA
jgi:hypothetical protein